MAEIWGRYRRSPTRTLTRTLTLTRRARRPRRRPRRPRTRSKRPSTARTPRCASASRTRRRAPTTTSQTRRPGRRAMRRDASRRRRLRAVRRASSAGDRCADRVALRFVDTLTQRKSGPPKGVQVLGCLTPRHAPFHHCLSLMYKVYSIRKRVTRRGVQRTEINIPRPNRAPAR